MCRACDLNCGFNQLLLCVCVCVLSCGQCDQMLLVTPASCQRNCVLCGQTINPQPVSVEKSRSFMHDLTPSAKESTPSLFLIF